MILGSVWFYHGLFWRFFGIIRAVRDPIGLIIAELHKQGGTGGGYAELHSRLALRLFLALKARSDDVSVSLPHQHRPSPWT
ncbi:MAG: hypothetical protein R3C68_01440 [Myxococcota bacterium]